MWKKQAAGFNTDFKLTWKSFRDYNSAHKPLP